MVTLNEEFASLAYQCKVGIQDAFRRAISEGLSDAMIAGIKEFGKSVNNVSGNRDLFFQANQALANSMHTAVLHSYDQTVTARKEFSSYRGSDPHWPRLVGTLRRALESGELIVATPQGIAFINEDVLNAEAIHWQRLQFGAGDRAGRPVVPVTIEFQGEPIGFLELTQAPRPAFFMPTGFWNDSGFYPGRSGRKRTEPSGIGARRFLDAGLVAFQRDFPIVYGDLMVQIQLKTLNSVKAPPSKHVTKKVVI